jgi:hypothetical protein
MHAAVATRDIRRLSRRLFGGAQYRLEVCAAIADGDGVVTASELVTQLGTPPGMGSVSMELRTLRGCGLLVPAPAPSSDRRVYLRRCESPLWATAAWLRDHAEEMVECARQND